MNIISSADVARQLNRTLSAGESTLAQAICDGLNAWLERFCRRKFASAQYTEKFDGGRDTYRIANAPISGTPTITIDGVAFTGTITVDGSLIKLSETAKTGWRIVSITYTGGFAAAPKDLVQALTEIATDHFQAATAGGRVITEVEADGYRERYSVDASKIPAAAMDVIKSYQNPHLGWS